jgi:hypothetical protein
VKDLTMLGLIHYFSQCQSPGEAYCNNTLGDFIDSTVASEKSLSSMIEKLWNDPNLCARLGANGKRFAVENCNEQKIAEHFKVYIKAIAQQDGN